MNYFFGIKNNNIHSEIQIPCFQNRTRKSIELSLFEGSINDGIWRFEELKKCKVNSDFFIVQNEIIDNQKIFFICQPNEVSKLEKKELKNFSKFTDTTPAFRSNLKIYLNNGGFSSYQSEYPYNMINNKGNILSPLSILLNKNADKNFLFLRNIYIKPIHEEFNLFFLDIHKKKIEEKIKIKTNYSNLIEINKNLIKPEIYIFTENFLGIPMYISQKESHLSFEHTHPPHEYILSNNKFKIIKELKNQINEIIS